MVMTDPMPFTVRIGWLPVRGGQVPCDLSLCPSYTLLVAAVLPLLVPLLPVVTG